MSKNSRNQFISLVRLGIGHSADPINLPIQWDEIETLANEQGLSAIVLDGIEKLPEEQRPQRQLLLQWIGNVMQGYENRYSDYETAISQLSGFYNQNGIKMMVLKGYGLSLNYPIPKHRPCGDIDTWNFGQQKEADRLLTTKLGIKVDESEHHHTVFYWKGYMVENHYDMLITSAAKTNKELEPVLKELAMDESHSKEINGERVYLPSANFNALFLLRHMLMHFVACGINIRNVLDWAFFWEKCGREVDVLWLDDIVKKYKMKDFYDIINAICVDELGFASCLFKSSKPDKEMKERVIEDILEPEYDWKEAHRLNLIPRISFKFKRWMAGTWKRKLCYKESSLTAFWISIWSHILKPSSI